MESENETRFFKFYSRRRKITIFSLILWKIRTFLESGKTLRYVDELIERKDSYLGTPGGISSMHKYDD